MATVHQANFNIAAAKTEMQRALQLAPGDANLVRRYSYFVSRLGDQSESLDLAKKALELDPLNEDSYGNWVGALADARRYEEAVRFAEETTRKSPELFQEPLLLAFCYLMLGRLQEAQEQFSAGRPDAWERLTGEALVFARQGDRASAERRIARMQELVGDAATYQYAEIYAELDDKERALAALEKAWAIRDPGLMGILVDPFFDSLRKEPRFAAIVDRMNFPA